MILNNSKNTLIAEKEVFYGSILAKIRGLMFTKTHKTIIFPFKRECRQHLHTFFVFYPIDLVFINSSKKVVEIKKNLKPFSYYNSKNKAQYVIECSQGTVDKARIKVGDRISFK